MVADAVYLSIVLDRTVRFVTTVHVVLEEYNTVCQITNDWTLNMFREYLGKHTLIALLMISSTPKITVCSSSK